MVVVSSSHQHRKGHNFWFSFVDFVVVVVFASEPDLLKSVQSNESLRAVKLETLFFQISKSMLHRITILIA